MIRLKIASLLETSMSQRKRTFFKKYSIINDIFIDS